MDKIAANIVDKLRLIEFFNVIVCGGVFLYGISPILTKYAPGFLYENLGLEGDFEKAVVTFLVCYILGNALQSMQEFLFKRVRTIVVNRCLNETSEDQVKDPDKERGGFENKYKRDDVLAKAVKLFTDKNLGTFDPKNPAMCQFYFDYCEYSNLINGYGSGADRLNELATFYEQLVVAFLTLTVVGLVYMVLEGANIFLYCMGYLLLGLIFLGRAYQSRLNWVRKVFTTYEVATDK